MLLLLLACNGGFDSVTVPDHSGDDVVDTAPDTDSDSAADTDTGDACSDRDGDGLCDDVDDDDDGDGLSDAEELELGEDCSISNPLHPDSDGDGVDDPSDPYPLDPWPEYVLFRNDVGTIDLVLSNRDGTFEPPVVIGDPFGGGSDTSYRYQAFSIADWDDDGKTDFLAVAAPIPATGAPADVWWFHRSGHSTGFEQRKLGTTDRVPFHMAADLDEDQRLDLVAFESLRPDNWYQKAWLTFFHNAGTVATATCFATKDPANPDGCAFVEKLAVDFSPFAANQWVVNIGRYAVDLDGDGHRDVAVFRIANGGNSPVPVAVMRGNGDGTLQQPETLFEHNTGGCGASPANQLLFADYDDDGLGDVIIGLDDDGDPGSAWFYPGKRDGSAFGFDTTRCKEAFDLNPAEEAASDRPGFGGITSFDFNFDGILDVMSGHTYTAPYSGPSRNELRLGKGDGTFEAPIVVRDVPTSLGLSFAIPNRLCPVFPR